MIASLRVSPLSLRPFLTGLLAASLALGGMRTPLAAQSAPAAKTATAVTSTRYSRNHHPKRESAYYAYVWGVDSFSVKSVESGELIRFSYRVLDPEKAKALNDKKNEPYLISPDSGVKLVIPSLEKVGQLRQSSTPTAGTSYWMAFSNPGRPVKAGDHVNIEIGQFHLPGLVVQ